MRQSSNPMTKVRQTFPVSTQDFLDRYRQVYDIPLETIVYLNSNGKKVTPQTTEAQIAVYHQNGSLLKNPSNLFQEIYRGLSAEGLFIGSFTLKRRSGLFSRYVISRNIAKAELLGYLVHEGFQIKEEQEKDDLFWLTAKKTGTRGTKEDINRAHRFFFSQERVGKEGKIIKVYKLRTMYPFSPLVQEYVFKKSSFGKMGKISDDFRITPWGKWLRKYWIDELPQLINILKGEMTLVGLRPLSLGFFKTLPEDLQKERIRYLPGLLPPIYADNPKNLEQRIQAEKKYLRLKKRYGFLIDVSYFFRILHIIIFKGVRGS